MPIYLCVGHLALHPLSLLREFPSLGLCMPAICIPSFSLLHRAHDSGLVNQKYLSQT